MAASDYVPIFFKNRLHLAGRPQMSTRPSHLEHNFVTLYKSAERFAGGRSWQIQGRGDGRLRRWF